jgi:DNA-binding response OmpR family regulator
MSKILIVEDNALMRDTIETALKFDEHTVLQAPDGPTGISMARSENPDLILLDLMMPFMTGEQVANYLNNDETLCSIPIIIVSAVNEPDQVLELLTLKNVRDYLLKPLDPNTLRQRTLAVLNGIGASGSERHTDNGDTNVAGDKASVKTA